MSADPGPMFAGHPLPHLLYELRTLRIVAANAAAARYYGRPVQALVGASRLDLLQPSEHDALRAFVDGLPHSAAAPRQRVWRERRADGAELLSDIRGMPFDPPGVAPGTLRLSVVMDARPRTGAEADARERAERAEQAERKLQATLRVLPDLWILFDADDRYREVGDPNHPSLSAPWAEKVGRPLRDTIPATLLRQMHASLADARRTGTLHPYLYELPTRDGTLRHFEGRCLPLDGGQWMALVRDVTETVHLEQRFRRLAEVVPVALFEADAQGRNRYVNPAWAALYQLPIEQGVGDAWLQAVHPDDREAQSLAWQAAVQGSRPYGFDSRIVRGDGSVRTVSVTSMPLRRADGQVTGHVGAVVDVTQARDLDDARRAREVAEEANRRQVAFLSRLSHELRTPLNAIMGFTDLLLLDEPAAPAATDRSSRAARLGYVRDAGRHMLALVDDLLELQHLQQGRVPLNPEPLDLAEALAAGAAMLEPMARRRGVTVTCDVPRPLVLTTDARALRQLLLNLGSNAVKYGRAGGHVRLTARPDGASQVRIDVVDDGEGLSPAALGRLFQPFERLDRAHGDQPGTGLGLVISRQLAQLLGGTLDLESTPGVGTTARLRLPI